MAQFSENGRQSSRATNALIFAAALLLAPALMATSASAQLLGYAAASPTAFPSRDAALALPEDESSPVPERPISALTP